MIWSERTLTQIGDKDPLMIDDEIEGQLARLLADDIADRRAPQKSAQLVFNRTDRFQAIALRPLDKGPLPEVQRHRIGNLAYNASPIALIGDHLIDADERRVLRIHTGPDRMIQDKLKPGTPALGEYTLKAIHEKIRMLGARIKRDVLDRIPGYGIVQ